MTAFDAIVLAGGTGERMGGADKGALMLAEVTFLERVLDATRVADDVVCVGPERPTSRKVTWTQESPAGGGPVAAVAAGLQHVEATIVTVLAVDHPFVTAEVVARLVETCAVNDVDAVLAGDDAGVPQRLLAAYRVPALSACLRAIGSPAGASMTRLTQGLRCVTVPAPDAAQDCDTPEDLERARQKAAEQERACPPAGDFE